MCGFIGRVKAITVTYKDTRGHKYTPAVYNQLQIPWEPPWAALLAERKPVSEPFWRCEWELRFSKLLLSKSVADSKLPAVHPVSLTSQPSLQPLPQVVYPPSSVYLKTHMPRFLCCLVTLRSLTLTGGRWEVKSSQMNRERGKERGGEKLLDKGKGI